MLTLEQLESIPAATLTADQVAEYLGCKAQNIRSQAQADAGALGFPVIVMGSRVIIPREGFCYFMRYGRTSIQHKAVR